MDSPSVEGKVAVVTGASRGLGAGLARTFAEHGLRLGLCARSDPALPAGDDVVTARLDVVDTEAVEAFAEQVAARLGPIDLWVNNAGVLAPIGPLRDLAGAEVRQHLLINVMGVINGSQAFVRHVRRRGGPGVLVNLTSGAAQHGYEGWSAYSTGKAAVDRLTEVVSLEEGSGGVTALAVAPGVVNTDMQALIRDCSPELFPAVERFREMERTGSFNSPEHVARHILALAFDPEARPEGWRVRVPDETDAGG